MIKHVKWQSNVEKHRGYISTHRNDASYSALYAAYEDTFIKITETDRNGKKETIYRMDKLEKNLLENFLTARNQGLLFQKSNIDKDGKPTIYEPDTGRPIIISDGVIPQCEAFCSKIAYNQLGLMQLQEAISQLNEKAEDATGNSYVFLCNEKFW